MRLGGHRSGAPPRGRRDKNRSPPCQFKRIRPIRRVLRRTWRSRIKGGSDMAKGSPPARKSAAKPVKKAKPRAKAAARNAESRTSRLAAGAEILRPTCRRWPGSGSPRARPASATRTGPTCFWPCWRPEPRSPASLPRRKRPPRPSNGAATWLKAGTARALVVNSGNANAFTGKKGTRRRCATSPTWRRRPSAAPPMKFSWRRPASSASRCRPNASPEFWASSPKRARPTAGATPPKRS